MAGLRNTSLAFWFMILASPIVAQTTGTLSRTASSSIRSTRDKYGNDVIITTNRRFTFVPAFLIDKGNRSMVLLEEFRSEWRPGIEGKKAKVRIDGWAGNFPNPRKKAWAIRSEGDIGEVQNNFYRVTRYGCCLSHTTYIWFSLLTGRKAFTSNFDLIAIEILGHPELTRYIGYHDGNSVLGPDEEKTVEKLVGTLYYSAEMKVQSKLLIRARSAKWDDWDLPQISVVSKDRILKAERHQPNEFRLIGASGENGKAALSDFSIRLLWYDGSEIVIPVKNDNLDLNKAIISDKLIVEAAR